MKRMPLSVLFVSALASNCYAQSFILDEDQASNVSSWPNGSSQKSVAFGGDYIHDDRSQDGSFVEWDLSAYVDQTKCYTVAAIWNANGYGSRSTAVRYEIDYDGGTATSIQDQNLKTNNFNVLSTDLGVNAFQNPTFVRVFTGDTTSSEQYVIADALQVSETSCDPNSETPAGPNDAAFGPALGADVWTHRMKTLDIWKQHSAARCDSSEAFVEIAGSSQGYCIETMERTAKNWEEARDDCLADEKRLPEPGEWKFACTRASSLGLSGMTNNWEWASNFATFYETPSYSLIGASVFGSGSCAYGSFSSVATNAGGQVARPYRCVR